MIRINQIKIEWKPGKSENRLELAELLDGAKVLQKKAAKLLGIKPADVSEVLILKHSIDARKKPRLFQVYTLGVVLE
ncbi:MAG: FAD-dependent oxidoreductase, partial [Lachnospiraceae bacterium]|nr:FAD-dependent oxidoreductase [Lachnospiraceae bacterium]